ncbi:hypothetical protein B0J14DRAFT_169312 [Halenospora varia]|nr:hypothetical protein B0J14DRAFT_169312 [Halenospora varia]
MLTLCDGTANERDNDHSVSNGEHTVTAKRRRSISPRPTVYHLGTSPLPYSEDAKSHREYIDYSDPDDSGDDDVRSKRRRLSAPLGGRATLNQHKKRSPRFPSPTLEDELDGTRIISADRKTVSTPTTTSAASESAFPIEPQLVAQVIDADQQWDVRRIIGKEDVDGVLHYWVAWCETLEPEPSLGHAKELVDEFEARLLAKREVKNGPKKPGLKRREHAVVGADASAQQQKRRHGRPRKQP